MNIQVLLGLPPKEIASQNSSSGKIKIVERGRERSLIVGNLLQSGSFMEKLWYKALVKIKDRKVKSILVLGAGAGSCVKPLKKIWPKCTIDAIEKDREIIKLAKNYLNLNDKLVNIKIADAFEFVEKAKANTYDLIVIDLYNGSKIPNEISDRNFFANLKRISKPNYCLIFNHLYFKNHKNKADQFVRKVNQYFDNVKTLKDFPVLPTNLLIFCYLKS